MKLIMLVVFIFLLIFLFLIIPFKVKFGAHLNVIENKGFYSLKVAFIKLLCGRMRVSDGKLEFENNNDLLFKNNSDEEYLNKVFTKILSKINVSNMELFIQFGNKYNAANTAIVCGSFQSIFCTIYVMLKTRYKGMYQFLDIDPNYNKDAFEITINAGFTISVLKVIQCLIKAKLELKVRNQNE